MDEMLKFVLAQVTDWLKFAEAKNGALLVVAMGMLIALVQLRVENADAVAGHALLLGSCVGFLFVAVAICLASFLPVTQIPFMVPRGKRLPSDNLLFFGDAAKYTGPYYLESLRQRLGPGQEDSPLAAAMAEQIVTNSRIAVWKYGCFKWALWSTGAAVLTPAGALVGWLLLNVTRRIK
jgi:hypothetical protein